MYTGPQLIDLLEKQHRDRQNSELFKKGQFTIQWRAKVGSFPHPDSETMISAAEPCGSWKAAQNCPQRLHRPEDKRQVGDNWQYFRELPLNGYLPGSAIRGLVRSWAKKRPEIRPRMEQLLGKQEDDRIQSGKIEFLDAWPDKPTKVFLDIINPQQEFQVLHEGQGKPVSMYTLGNGKDVISLTVAIRGIPRRKATAEEVAEVWGWVEQALSLYGVGSRTASGYGHLKPGESVQLQLDPNSRQQQFTFKLYSQGNAGPDMKTLELRPSHWRGWLRSWIWRFLLGVMSPENAKQTLWELLGTLEPSTHQGCVRMAIARGNDWGKDSATSPDFYYWTGHFTLTAPQDILDPILLPIIRFAVMVGGVGRGWRRPLHLYWMETKHDSREASRGTYLKLSHEVNSELKLFGLPLKPENWDGAYQKWKDAVQQKWRRRFQVPAEPIKAEIFSPQTCAVYCVPGPTEEPIAFSELSWEDMDAQETRGEGMELIYKPPYKKNIDVGGKADRSGAYCSWVSIKRVNVKHPNVNTDCQEVVCLFLGDENQLRSQFLKNLSEIQGARHLFGESP